MVVQADASSWSGMTFLHRYCRNVGGFEVKMPENSLNMTINLENQGQGGSSTVSVIVHANASSRPGVTLVAEIAEILAIWGVKMP